MSDQKSNPQNYKYKIVQHFETSKDAIMREAKLHLIYDVGVNEKFYNKTRQTETGHDSTGTKASEELRKKLSIAHLGIKDSLETREKKSKAAIGKPKTKEHIENARLASIAAIKLNPRKPTSNETKEKQRAANTGKKRTSEQCARIAASLIGKKQSEEHRAKNSLVRTGVNNTFFAGYYVTPKFTTAIRKELEAANVCKKWCIDSARIISKSSYTKSIYLQNNYSWEFLQDKTFADIGFGFIPKD